jgi:hypothetical protein
MKAEKASSSISSFPPVNDLKAYRGPRFYILGITVFLAF